MIKTVNVKGIKYIRHLIIGGKDNITKFSIKFLVVVGMLLFIK